MTDYKYGSPLFPVSTKVMSHVFHDTSEVKTVFDARWDGAEYRYTLVNSKGIEDEGYLAKDLRRQR